MLCVCFNSTQSASLTSDNAEHARVGGMEAIFNTICFLGLLVLFNLNAEHASVDGMKAIFKTQFVSCNGMLIFI